jgi:hypothetical protein
MNPEDFRVMIEKVAGQKKRFEAARRSMLGCATLEDLELLNVSSSGVFVVVTTMWPEFMVTITEDEFNALIAAVR